MEYKLHEYFKLDRACPTLCSLFKKSILASRAREMMPLKDMIERISKANFRKGQ